MNSTQFFLESLMQKYVQRYRDALIIEIADASGVIIADSGGERVSSKSATSMYAIDTKQPMMVGDPASEDGHMRYYIPVIAGSKVWGVVITRGRLDIIRSCGEAISDAIGSFLSYEDSMRQKSGTPERRVVSGLISGSFDRDFILQNVGTSHYSDDNIYAVILVKLELSSMNYFNINLDLGYQSTFEVMQTSLLEVIGNNAHITQRDIFAFTDDDSIVIIKSFLKIEDISKVYLALDRICHSILEDLKDHAVFRFCVCYGNTCSSLFDVQKSYEDAREIMDMSLALNPGGSFYTLEDILFENVCQTLHPQIVNKMLLPYLEMIGADDSSFTDDLLHVAEKYVDHCMRVSPAAQSLFLHRNTVDAKLDRFKKATGLDPSKTFKDAFLVKMMAIYFRRRESPGQQ